MPAGPTEVCFRLSCVLGPEAVRLGCPVMPHRAAMPRLITSTATNRLCGWPVQDIFAGRDQPNNAGRSSPYDEAAAPETLSF